MSSITNDLNLAIAELQSGKAVAIPTETVYGLAALISNEEAIKSVFSMKNRPSTHPLIVHVALDYDLHNLVEEIPEYAQQLMKEFWPGPMTLVLNAKPGHINPTITGGQSTVAIRCPSHPIAQQLLSKLYQPVVAPSANPFGKISPTTALDVQQAFEDFPLTILEGGRCVIGIESTIIDATNPSQYKILRHGLIDEKAIAAVVPTHFSESESSIRVPGKLDSHYQPQKMLFYFEEYERLAQFCETNEQEVYVIASKSPNNISKSHYYPLKNTPEEVAFDLYYQLRQADKSLAACIAVELPPNTSQWQGIRERILKAGQPFLG